MHVFGCQASVLKSPLQLQKDGKLEDRSVLGTFVGYSENTAGYRILLSSGSIIESSDVLFFDDTVISVNQGQFQKRKEILEQELPDYPKEQEPEISVQQLSNSEPASEVKSTSKRSSGLSSPHFSPLPSPRSAKPNPVSLRVSVTPLSKTAEAVNSALPDPLNQDKKEAESKDLHIDEQAHDFPIDDPVPSPTFPNTLDTHGTPNGFSSPPETATNSLPNTETISQLPNT
jgi:hypothetical protein